MICFVMLDIFNFIVRKNFKTQNDWNLNDKMKGL